MAEGSCECRFFVAEKKIFCQRNTRSVSWMPGIESVLFALKLGQFNGGLHGKHKKVLFVNGMFGSSCALTGSGLRLAWTNLRATK